MWFKAGQNHGYYKLNGGSGLRPSGLFQFQRYSFRLHRHRWQDKSNMKYKNRKVVRLPHLRSYGKSIHLVLSVVDVLLGKVAAFQ